MLPYMPRPSGMLVVLIVIELIVSYVVWIGHVPHKVRHMHFLSVVLDVKTKVHDGSLEFLLIVKGNEETTSDLVDNTPR